MFAWMLVAATLVVAALFGWWAARWRAGGASLVDDAGAYGVHRLTAVDDREIGVAVRGTEVLTALSVATGSDRLAVFAAGADLDDGGARFPLDVLGAALARHVPELAGIELWSRGRRAGTGPLGDAHERLAGDVPVVGRIECTVVLRLEIGSATPEADLGRAIGLATERVRRLLVNRGLPATVLTAAGLEEVVGWRAGDVASIESMVSMVSLCRSAEPDRPLTVHTRPPAGDPNGTLGILAGVDDLAPYAPAAHGDGQILGATKSGELAALALAGPHLTDTVILADSATTTGLLARAIGAGFVLGLRTDRPGRWSGLVELAGTALVILDHHPADAEIGVDAVVWDLAGGAFGDRAAVAATTHPPTSIHVVETGPGADSDDCTRALEFGADLVLDGRVPGWLAVERPGRPTTTVRLVTIPEERDLLRAHRTDRVRS